jgi:hypothetical protein
VLQQSPTGVEFSSFVPQLRRLHPDPVCKCDAACVQFLNSHDQEVTLYDPVEIRKQIAFGEAEEPEFEPKERTVTVCSRLRVLD